MGDSENGEKTHRFVRVGLPPLRAKDPFVRNAQGRDYLPANLLKLRVGISENDAILHFKKMRKTQNGSRRKLTVLSLAAATYFMVSGGPYGMEELVQDAGYKLAVIILFFTPLIWSLPTGLMV